MRQKLKPEDILNVDSLLEKGEAKLIPFDHRYAVAKDGRFFSRCKGHWKINKPIMPTGETNFYIRHTVGRGKTIHLHVLMALAFFGNRPHKHVVRHLNGDPLDNRIENLSYGTYKDNSQDTITHNRAIRGSKQHNAKLDEEKVRQIRCLAKSGHSQLEISNLFNIDRRIINDILKARSWGWLDDYKHGPLIEAKSAKWGRSCNARYSEDDIRSIKKLKDLGKTHKEIAAIYNCHFNTISLILRGKSLTAKRVLNENGKKKT